MLEVTTERDPSMAVMPHRLTKPDHPRAIDAFIDYWQTTDEEVLQLLAAAADRAPVVVRA